MIKEVVVFGAQTFIGFSLCERLTEEGIHVNAVLLKSNDDWRRKLLEERLMMVGRNALFKVTCIEEITEDDSFDYLIYCSENGDDLSVLETDKDLCKRAAQLVDSKNVAAYYFSNFSNNDIHMKHSFAIEKHLLLSNRNWSIIKLPMLYGPFQPSPDIKQYLDSNDESMLYIEDAVRECYQLLKGNQFPGKVIFLSSKQSEQLIDDKLEEMKQFPLYDVIETIYVENLTDLTEGKKKVEEYFESYRQILSLKK
ncbi:hypothetical protein [Metabacillus malikii]|uniref:Nucleoside-diphosphate-sugar epimerase n=1 Tax=Metabacillus malikii TaxID=1504265 RepID=A0ABT9ZL91_9BACI|nr:hypothetical protein [Metabacillus malikii]MDQ0232293.1 nucleoside-diphosphate-sugar epimerase [Metabacillus malikii]